MGDTEARESIPDQREERRQKRLYLALTLAVLLLLTAAVFWKGDKPQYSDKMEPNAVNGVMPGKSEQQLQEELNQTAMEKQVAVTLNSEIVFPGPGESGSILFENSAVNTDKLLRLELYLGEDDGGTLIYQTGYLRPGSYVPSAKLNVTLEPGAYRCTAYIYVNRESDEAYLGRLSVGNIVVTVQQPRS